MAHNPERYLAAVLKTLQEIHAECVKQPTKSVMDFLGNLYADLNVREIRYLYRYIFSERSYSPASTVNGDHNNVLKVSLQLVHHY